MTPLLLSPVVVTIRAGRCAGCGAARVTLVNADGKTQCAGCAVSR